MSDALVSPEFIREYLDYDPETGVLTRRKRQPGCSPGQVAGHRDKYGYLNLNLKCRLYYAHRVAWAHFYGKWPDNILDHINCDRADNRIVNLREATVSQNKANSKVSTRNTSGAKGVYWNKRENKWIARIRHGGRDVFLGSFHTLPDAAQAYDLAAVEMHGEFALTNAQLGSAS